MKFKIQMDICDYLGYRTVKQNQLGEIELFERIALWIMLATRKSAKCNNFKIIIQEDKE